MHCWPQIKFVIKLKSKKLLIIEGYIRGKVREREKTRTKFVNKYVYQRCNEIRRSESFKEITLSLIDKKVVLCDIYDYK